MKMLIFYIALICVVVSILRYKGVEFKIRLLSASFAIYFCIVVLPDSSF